MDWVQIALAGGTWALVACTAWLVVKQLSIAREQLRAYVFLKQIKVKIIPADGVPPLNYQFKPLWNNSGATPTRHLRVDTHRAFFPARMPDTYEFEEDNQIPASHLAGPHSTFEGPPIVVPAFLITEVASAHQSLYIWGWVDYDDVFKYVLKRLFRRTTRHRTEFCVNVIPDRIADTDRYSFRFIFHNRYNGSDDECLYNSAPPH